MSTSTRVNWFFLLLGITMVVSVMAEKGTVAYGLGVGGTGLIMTLVASNNLKKVYLD